MEFRELKSLSVLAESGSLSETARVVHLSPAAIHKQIKHLEEELQVTLYERRDGRLRMTPAAELLLPYLRDILGQYESAVSALDEWRGVRRGLLRVGAGPTMATYEFPRILQRYHDEFPAVDLDIQTGNTQQLTQSLREGELDLAFMVAPESLEDSSLEVVLEHRTEIVLVCKPGTAPARGSLKTLRKFPFLLFRKGSRTEDLIDRYWAAHCPLPRVVMRFDSAEAMKTMVIQGSGMSMLPLYAVEEDIRTGRLQRVSQKEPPLIMRMSMLARKAGYVPPAVREFVRISKAVLAGRSSGV